MVVMINRNDPRRIFWSAFAGLAYVALITLLAWRGDYLTPLVMGLPTLMICAILFTVLSSYDDYGSFGRGAILGAYIQTPAVIALVWLLLEKPRKPNA